TAALDSESGKLIMDLLQELAHEQKRAIVVVTHDNRIFDYADRIVEIEDGKISNTEIDKEIAAAPRMVAASTLENIPQTA
ncbi:MAG: hypothetical protein M3Q99_20765, partial [Acidobacteriota bacterium]|nr:hypothetical protein [Acidobacteriota bacterium]